MRRNLLLWAAVLAMIGLLLPPAARAAPDTCSRLPVDLVLVLDDSGSMSATDSERNDPDNLRITAAHLMVDLLDPEDRVGLVLFAGDLREVAALAPAGAGAPDQHARIDRFRSQGGTRLDLALEAGLNQLASSSGRRKAVLFLTDGRPDTDPEGQKRRLVELAARARRMDVALYVIGLGSGYDRTLLEQVTAVSQSQQLWHVVEPSHLSTAFLEILRNLKDLNIETSTNGRVDVLGLSPEVRFAALRAGQGAAAEVEWPGGELTGRAESPTAVPGVQYGYDLLTYLAKSRGPGTATTHAPVVWKIERPPVAARFEAPGARTEVDSGEVLPVRLVLSPCGSDPVPVGLKATVQVLDADRKPTPYQADLTGTGGVLTGDLPMPAEAGTYVLSARVLTAEGRQVTVAEQTVSTVPRSRWLLDAPNALANGAEGTVTVRHRFGGKPAGGAPGGLVATFPDGTVQTLPLQGDGGTWTAKLTAPPDRTGEIRFDLGPGKATTTTKVEPVRFVLDAPGPVVVPFLGRTADLVLRGKTTGPVASTGVIPIYQGDGFTQGEWTGNYTANASVTLPRATWHNLFLWRDKNLTIQPKQGPYLATESLTLQVREAPLLPWYRLLPLLLALALTGWLLWRRLYGGPQLPIAVGGVYLMERRPGLLARFANPRTQREITVGGIGSTAAVKLKELPPAALLKVSARGIPGRERFRLENLNRSLPMLYKGMLPRNRISLKGRGPAPAISVGDIPLQILLHPKRPRR